MFLSHLCFHTLLYVFRMYLMMLPAETLHSLLLVGKP